ncbi:MAG: hypothetical protein WC805_03910 [Patescibacteria group bacterium]|jgi:hypothetical protein
MTGEIPDTITDQAVAAAVNIVFCLPNVYIKQGMFPAHTRAIALFPERREMPQFTLALDKFNHYSTSINHLLVAGNRVDVQSYEAIWQIISEGVHRTHPFYGHFEIQKGSENVKEQADWIAGQISARKIKHTFLITSQWHMPRVFLTLSKSLIINGMGQTTIIEPVAAPVDWFAPIPGGDGTSPNDEVFKEMRRIADYQKKGHVATLEELRDYVHFICSMAT